MAVARLVPRQAAAGKAFRCKPRFGIWNAGGAIAGIDAQATADDPCVFRTMIALFLLRYLMALFMRSVVASCNLIRLPITVADPRALSGSNRICPSTKRAVARELRMNGEPALWPP
jgi:hypothetical protein